MSSEERELLRQEESLRVRESMEQWLTSFTATTVLPKSKFGETLIYLRIHLDALRVYLRDDRMPIDNNAVEQLMKQVALGSQTGCLWVGCQPGRFPRTS